MLWLAVIRSLPLRTKVVLTLTGAGLGALGLSTFFSFRYWEEQALATVREQALLAGVSTQAAIESALRLGRPEPARHALTRLQVGGSPLEARVYGPDGRVILSAHRSEEGMSAGSRWIPEAAELPRSGTVSMSDDRNSARAYFPLSLPAAAVLEVVMFAAPAREGIRKGMYLGMALVAVSLLAMGSVVATMLEREVVAPLHRVEVLLHSGPGHGAPASRPGDLSDLEDSVRDIVERGEEMAAEAREQSRQMEAREGLAQVGELAAEMAHEFKRPLASIQTAVSVLDQEYDITEQGREVLDAVHLQLRRLEETMQDLFGLAKPLVMNEDSVNLAETLDDALAGLVGFPGMERVGIHRLYMLPEAEVPGDRHRLRQAFLNLLTNAVEAMPRGGEITIGVTPAEGGGVEVSIADTGAGLDPAATERALKPFYSTKPTGTGLGLPLVARIVSAHAGAMVIESSPGRGTRVRVVLPGRAVAHTPEG
ncbi:MAG: ATP-binding protein [Gemmatimonadota bacterium]|nr:ATP-binding protein [Gemmatimonadota bacterium]MDH5757960.1 ATP-binding protein [Gemmatimonadota bacterium]